MDNNVSGTNNLLVAIVESGLDIHVVHLGTMGVYGEWVATYVARTHARSLYTVRACAECVEISAHSTNC